MNLLIVCSSLYLSLLILPSSLALPTADHGYGSVPFGDTESRVQHTHHHYYHDERNGDYRKPQVPQSSYGTPYVPQNAYVPPQHGYAVPQYGYNNNGYYQPGYVQPNYQHYAPPPRYPRRGYASSYGYHEEDPYLHVHKEELTRSALLLGAGIVKGVLLTALINNGNNGVTIG